MAVEKGLVLTAIETKFKGKSLSKTLKDNLATKWAAKIETDADIDEYINDREDIVLEASAEADRRVTEAVKIANEKNKEGKDLSKKDDTVILDNDAPEWAKALLKQNQDLSEKLEVFQTQNQQKTLEERFKSNPDLKGIPEFMFKGRIPKTEEEFDTAVQELKTDYTTFAEANKLSNLGLDIPGGGNQKPNPIKNEVPAEVKAFAEKLKNSTN
ncbi:hypothetical protein [Flavobacterium sp. UMI-01]|uniref:hypothetical protein n=1 Tax=Flavobacterium sp. UMI-01 TaxID=1441053 RepID=UPI001C7DCCC5|nr:hypothetical protein [Flavobacterium sp. UMI-01]GIZ08370.1 hypothetical protein FUMI01_10970 [Flavobacterium sp. UMI-01]